jgi:hypothetical protein
VGVFPAADSHSLLAIRICLDRIPRLTMWTHHGEWPAEGLQ